MGALTKREIAELINTQLGFSLRTSLQLVDELLKGLKAALKTGHEVKIVRFGTFRPTDRPARQGIDLTDGRAVRIPARRSVVFHPSRTLKRLVNSQRCPEDQDV